MIENVCELMGIRLDYWVAIAEGVPDHVPGTWLDRWARKYSPSSNQDHGGEIIDRDGISTTKYYEPIDGPTMKGREWVAISMDKKITMHGPSRLIDAMRVRVAAKFGEYVERSND